MVVSQLPSYRGCCAALTSRWPKSTTNPFLYFVGHTDPELVTAVQEGRKAEFAAFMAAHEGEPPDPASMETFERSKPDWACAGEGWHAELRSLYKELIRLRKTVRALSNLSKENLAVLAFESERVVTMQRWSGESRALVAFNFNEQTSSVAVSAPPGRWRRVAGSTGGEPGVLQTSTGQLDLALEAQSFVLYLQEAAQ